MQKACLVKQIYKPNSVSHQDATLIIYLRLLLLVNFSCLPSNNRTCTLKRQYT